jgi:HAD superfamily hydrolase (TIGR01509 family)
MISPEQPPQLVIFDCDGVLVDSEPISNGVLARMLNEQGLSTTLEQARSEYQGLLLSEVLERAERRLGRGLPQGWLASYEREREAVRAAGVEVCVASQGKLSKTRLSLELTGMRALFAEDALFSAESVPRGKPHPDLFLYAASCMQSGVEDCVVVEDTPLGAAAGVAAGMRVLGYAADSDEQALRDAGAQVVGSLEQAVREIGL